LEEVRISGAPPEGVRLEAQDAFAYRQGELYCEEVPASQIAAEYGTPCFVYSAGLLRSRYRRIQEAFAAFDPLVCFSVKSCGNLSVLKLLAEEGSGFDVVSGGELHRVVLAGGRPERIVFAGVGKTRAEIARALKERIFMFNVESAAELERIGEVAEGLGAVASVAIRVNPDVDPQTHAKTATGKGETKFGVDSQHIPQLVERAAGLPGVQFAGLHVHIGSPIATPAPYEAALAKISGLIEQLRAAGHRVEYLNVGGGYCISYTGEQVTGPEQYADAMRPYLEKSECQVIIEPGRYISGSSGLLLTEVVYTKQKASGKEFVICDASMTELIRPTLYGAFHRIWPVRSESGMPPVLRPDGTGSEGIETRVVDVVGGVCESGDFLARARPLPPVGQGELLAVFDAGAYGFTMSMNYNGRPRPAEVLVEGGTCRLIRRRESYEDLVALEKEFL